MSFAIFGLAEKIIQGVYASGHSTPTEIQTMAITPIVQGRDVLGCAPTGTGKTAAFVLPILSRLLQPSQFRRAANQPRVLVLTPTRELAIQVEQSFRTYGVYADFKTLTIYGGVSITNQLRDLKGGIDIIVATPGRLMDHLQRRSIDLSRVEILVLDEADRMYDMGFIHDVRKIIACVPKKRQTLLFSATMSQEIRTLVASIQHNPETIEVGLRATPVESVDQQFYHVAQNQKFNLLVHILKKETVETMLVFSRTIHGADRINKRLQRCGIRSTALHADRSQGQRLRALDGFKRREFQVLVATDIAARGIDVTGISHVVNYDTPAYAEDYIHRIGRTGRAELTGQAMTFVCEEEKKNLDKIQKHTNLTFDLLKYPGFHPPERVTPDSPATPAGKKPLQKAQRPIRFKKAKMNHG